MRALTEEETRQVFEKLKKFLGANLQLLVDRADGENYVFRLHKDRVFYMSENLLRKAQHIPRKCLLSAGVCFGKFTHSRKFRLHITCLDYLAKLATHKIWVKPTGEQSFVYGNHVVKVAPGFTGNHGCQAHLRRVTEDTPANTGVVILNEQEVPLGFGVTAKSVGECRTAGPEQIVVYHQADIGEYLREEANLV